MTQSWHNTVRYDTVCCDSVCLSSDTMNHSTLPPPSSHTWSSPRLIVTFIFSVLLCNPWLGFERMVDCNTVVGDRAKIVKSVREM